MFEIRPGHHRAGDLGLCGQSRQANPWSGLPGFGCHAGPYYGGGMEDPLAVPIPDYAHRVAMYDMDRTITRSGTYSGFLIHVARRRQRWRLLLLPLVGLRSEEHTSELQSLMRISYAVFCLKKKNKYIRL